MQGDSAVLESVRYFFEQYETGFGRRFIVSEYGPFVRRGNSEKPKDDRFAVIYPLYIAGSKESREAGVFPENNAINEKFATLLNQNSLDDLTIIKQVLQHTGIEVVDLQFLIDPHGHLVIADPANIIIPFRRTDIGYIERIEKMARENIARGR